MASLLLSKTIKKTEGILAVYKDTPGSFVYEAPEGIKFIEVSMVGGGGGGGGAHVSSAAGTKIAGAGGCSGGHMVRQNLCVLPRQKFTCVVGAGSAGGIGVYNTVFNTGNRPTTAVRGGSTTFGSIITCTGGAGGNGGYSVENGTGPAWVPAIGGPGQCIIDPTIDPSLFRYGWVSGHDVLYYHLSLVAPSPTVFPYYDWQRCGGWGGCNVPTGVTAKLGGSAGYTNKSGTQVNTAVSGTLYSASDWEAGGPGGASYFANGANSVNSQQHALAGYKGSGGSGANSWNNYSDAGRNGGKGGDGFISIREFFCDDPIFLFSMSPERNKAYVGS